jgi:hypothetical protein
MSEPEPTMWLRRNTAADLYFLDGPWQAQRAERRPDVATHVAEFVEMLCQIDERFDELLPECWMRHGYIFAVMDALRCEYASAYVGRFARNTKGDVFLAASQQSRDQFQFWLDVSAAYTLISDYCTSRAIKPGIEEPHEPVKAYSRQTEARRSAERALGVEPIECYPFDDNTLSPLTVGADDVPPAQGPLPPAAEGLGGGTLTV